MGMTITQKILAEHAGVPEVKAGDLIEAKLDLVLGNDITAPVAIGEMDKFRTDGVFDKDKIALVLDHFVPAKDIKSAENCKCVRNFAGSAGKQRPGFAGRGGSAAKARGRTGHRERKQL